MRPELIIFDMDGLIFDTERLYMEASTEVMAERGYTMTREIYTQLIGTAGETFLQLMHGFFGEDIDTESIGKEARARMDARVDATCLGMPLKPGILDLLVHLVEQDIPCVIASSTPSASVKKYIAESGIEWYFQDVIGGELVKDSKPNPEIFLLACERNHVEPANALVIEDSENGIRAAHNAGIPVICIPDMVEPSKEVADMTAAVVKDGFQVIEML